ncbi:MAG: IreB family regulatory phosphoprotein [Candidatus Avilachnospira sp.]
MSNMQNTQIIGQVKGNKPDVSDVLRDVYNALVEKGYNPINQIVGYIMSGDPTYITSHKNARSLIMKVERDEILEELMASYIKSELNG